jgi:4-hydroxysphinganine ceramide fatty acyl 2-hydroxylase
MGEERSARIFENEALERMSRSHPVINTAVGAALAAACLSQVHFAWLGWGKSCALIAGAVVAWTLIEYAAHRFFFHWTPRSPALAKAMYLVHQYHHDFPNERSRNMFPLAVSLPTALLVWLLIWAVLPSNANLLVFAIIVLCFTGYDVVHYLHHVPTGFMPVLRRRHMLHHFRDPDANYGVTTSLWDHVFGTLKPEAPIRSLRSET